MACVLSHGSSRARQLGVIRLDVQVLTGVAFRKLHCSFALQAPGAGGCGTGSAAVVGYSACWVSWCPIWAIWDVQWGPGDRAVPPYRFCWWPLNLLQVCVPL